MMSSIMRYFTGGKDAKQSARDAIVLLRQNMQMLEKKEEYLQKRIDEELRKARENAVSNKPVATAALRRKNMMDAELKRLEGTRMQLETQIMTLEAANFNQETLNAMKKGSDALRVIHGNITIDKVDKTMTEINEQREIAAEISDAISANPNADMDDEELKRELEEMEKDKLDELLAGAERAPTTTLPAAIKEPPKRATEEEDEEAQLRELQAELAM